MKNLTYLFFAFWILMVGFIFFMPRAEAEEKWMTDTVICESDRNEILEFYKEEELLPLMAGAGRAPASDGTMGEKIVHVIMQDPDGGFALISYKESGYMCLTAVGRNTIHDANQLMDWLGMQ